MMNFTRNLWKRGRHQSLSTNEIELTDAQLAAVQGAVGDHVGGTGAHHDDHDGGHHGHGWYGGGYPSYYPSYYPYGYGYGYQPAPQVVLVESVPATTQQTPCSSLPVSGFPVV